MAVWPIGENVTVVPTFQEMEEWRANATKRWLENSGPLYGEAVQCTLRGSDGAGFVVLDLAGGGQAGNNRPRQAFLRIGFNGCAGKARRQTQSQNPRRRVA